MGKKLLYKFAHFMQGRHGIDQLYIASSVLALILMFLQLFIQSTFLNFLILALIFWTIYRFFSKNRSARQAENFKWLQFVSKFQQKTNLPKRRLQEIKTHRYRKCKNCKTTLRLPRKRGKHKVRCPRCNHLNEVSILL